MKNLSTLAPGLCIWMALYSDKPATACEINAHFDYSISNNTAWFNDLSTATAGVFISAWQWDFGDGAIGTQQFPVHVFPASGTFTVCLTAYASEGNSPCQHTWCTELEIQEESLCFVTAGFAYNLLENGSIQFAQQSYGNVFTDMVSYEWSMGDGTTDTSLAPLHIYNQPQNVQVCLTATGEAYGNICSAIQCQQIEVNNFPCELEVQFTAVDLGNCLFEFTPQVTVGSWTNVNELVWNTASEIFGEQEPRYLFAEAGSHQVCLTASATAPQGLCTVQHCEEIETACVQEEELATGEIFESDFRIYPNPASGFVYIEAQANALATIVDMLGNEILRGSTGSLDLSSLAQGNYYVRVISGSGKIEGALLTKLN